MGRGRPVRAGHPWAAGRADPRRRLRYARGPGGRPDRRRRGWGLRGRRRGRRAPGAVPHRRAPPRPGHLWRVRSWKDFQNLAPEGQARVLPFIRRWVEAAADVSGARVLACYQSILDIQRMSVAATLPFDVVVSPVAPVAAFPAEWPMPFGDHDRGMVHIGFTAPANMSGQPSISVNAGFTEDGRPSGSRSPVAGSTTSGCSVPPRGGRPPDPRPRPGLADPLPVGRGPAQADHRCDTRLGSGRMTSGVTSQTPSRPTRSPDSSGMPFPATPGRRESPTAGPAAPARRADPDRCRRCLRLPEVAEGRHSASNPRRRSAGPARSSGVSTTTGCSSRPSRLHRRMPSAPTVRSRSPTTRSSRSAVIAGSVTGRRGQSGGKVLEGHAHQPAGRDVHTQPVVHRTVTACGGWMTP